MRRHHRLVLPAKSCCIDRAPPFLGRRAVKLCALTELHKLQKKFSIKHKNTEKYSKGGRNRFKPDTRAEGAHSVFRRDPMTGRVTHYETFRPQTNPYDPKPWESVLRFDAIGNLYLLSNLV